MVIMKMSYCELPFLSTTITLEQGEVPAGFSRLPLIWKPTCPRYYPNKTALAESLQKTKKWGKKIDNEACSKPARNNILVTTTEASHNKRPVSVMAR